MDKPIPLEEMAAMLSRTPRQFRKDVANRKIPHIELGREKLFDAAEVIEHLKAPTLKLAPVKKRTVIHGGGRFAGRLGLA